MPGRKPVAWHWRFLAALLLGTIPVAILFAWIGSVSAHTPWYGIMAAILVPLVIVGSAGWVGVLAFTNVRQRRAEVGILRAIGLRSRVIFSIFLVKALLIGLLGASLGYAGGFVVGAAWREAGATAGVSSLFSPALLIPVFLLAPLLSGVAAWAPAMMAARQDPAVVLREE